MAQAIQRAVLHHGQQDVVAEASRVFNEHYTDEDCERLDIDGVEEPTATIFLSTPPGPRRARLLRICARGGYGLMRIIMLKHPQTVLSVRVLLLTMGKTNVNHSRKVTVPHSHI